MQKPSEYKESLNEKLLSGRTYRTILTFSMLLIAACSTVKSPITEAKNHQKSPELSQRAKLHHELQKILAVLEIDMGIDGSLRNLPAIKEYIKKGLQKNGVNNPDVHVELNTSPLISEDGKYPLLTAVIGSSGVATSSQLGTEDENTNSWLREQFRKNFLYSFTPDLNKIISFGENKNLDGELYGEILSLFFTKYREDFRENGMLLLGCALALDKETGVFTILLSYIDPRTGKKETAKIPLTIKKKARSAISIA